MTRRLLAAGATALALGSLALSPLSAAAQNAAPIGTAAPLPPDQAAPAAPAPQPPAPPQAPGNPELQALLSGSDQAALAGERLLQPGLLRQFYADRGNEPLWGTYPERASALLGAVFRAEDQGLSPTLFHAEALSRRAAALSPVARDVLISDAILAYADALAEGAVPPRARPGTQSLHPMPIDVVVAVERAIAAPDPAAALVALAPASPEYETMRRAYAYYHALAVGMPVAQPDAPYAGAARVSRSARYGRGGGAGDDEEAGDDPDAGYAGSWRVSPAAAARRARQLAVNLERLRWLPREMPRERVVVNTATQRLQLFQDDRPVFSTRVVVGQPTWQTPEFHAQITAVEFNPPWNVPPSIFRKEIEPKLARDPHYLARHHMHWRGSMTVQQEAGPHSSLGRLKFEVSDPFGIYLHDTPEKHLFRLANRTKSHGCVRVEYPQELAALVLHESPEAVERSIAGERTYWQALANPVEVYIVYQTAAVTPSGAIAFYADPYGRDAEIWQLLIRPGGAPLAQDSGLDERNG